MDALTCILQAIGPGRRPPCGPAGGQGWLHAAFALLPDQAYAAALEIHYGNHSRRLAHEFQSFHFHDKHQAEKNAGLPVKMLWKFCLSDIFLMFAAVDTQGLRIRILESPGSNFQSKQ